MRLRTGNQWSSRKTGVMWSNFLVFVVTRAAAFWTACSFFSKPSWVMPTSNFLTHTQMPQRRSTVLQQYDWWCMTRRRVLRPSSYSTCRAFYFCYVYRCVLLDKTRLSGSCWRSLRLVHGPCCSSLPGIGLPLSNQCIASLCLTYRHCRRVLNEINSVSK